MDDDVDTVKVGEGDAAPKLDIDVDAVKVGEGDDAPKLDIDVDTVKVGEGDDAPKLDIDVDTVKVGEGDDAPKVDIDVDTVKVGEGDAAPKVDLDVDAVKVGEGDDAPKVDIDVDAVKMGEGDDAPKLDIDVDAVKMGEGDDAPKLDIDVDAVKMGEGDGAPKLDLDVDAVKMGEGTEAHKLDIDDDAMKMERDALSNSVHIGDADDSAGKLSSLGEDGRSGLNCQHVVPNVTNVNCIGGLRPNEHFDTNDLKRTVNEENDGSQHGRRNGDKTAISQHKQTRSDLRYGICHDVRKVSCEEPKRSNLQIDDSFQRGNANADLLQTVGLFPRNNNPIQDRDKTDIGLLKDHTLRNFRETFPKDFFLNMTKAQEHAQTVFAPDSERNISGKSFKDLPDLFGDFDHIKNNNQEFSNLQSEGKSRQTSWKMSKEGKIRARNRKCSTPKRVPAQYLGGRELIINPSSYQSPELDCKDFSCNSSIIPRQEDSKQYDLSNRKTLRPTCFVQPDLPQTAQIQSPDSKDHVFNGIGSLNGEGLKTQGLILPTIKKETDEEASEIHFPTSTDNARRIVDKKIRQTELPKESQKEITSIDAYQNETECKTECQSFEDCANLEYYQWEQSAINRNKRKVNYVHEEKLDKPQISPCIPENKKRFNEFEPELPTIKLSPTFDKDNVTSMGDFQRREVRGNDNVVKEEEPSVTKIKQEIVQEYELDHWCDLGPTSPYTGNDSFDHKDDKEEIHNSINDTDSKTHTPEEDKNETCKALLNTVKFTPGPAQHHIPFESPQSAFHRPIKQNVSTVDAHSATPVSTPDSYSCGDRRSQYIYPLSRTPYLPAMLNSQHLSSQFSTQSMAISTSSGKPLSPSQPDSFSFPNTLYMYPQFARQTPPYGLNQYPYVAMISQQSKWNLLQSPSPTTHENYIPSLRQQGYLDTSSDTIEFHAKPSTGSVLPKGGDIDSTKPDYGIDSFEKATSEADSATQANQTPTPCSVGQDNASLRSISKPRLRKRNEDFLDPTAMKFGFDDDEESDDGDQIQIASDEEWKPERVRGEDGHNANSGLEDDDEACGQRTQPKRNRSNYRNRMDPANSLTNTANLIQVLKKSQGNEKKCPACGKLCKGNYQLRRHQMSHSEFRPYRCPQCDKGFKQKAHLKGHTKSVHSKPEQVKPAKTKGSNQRNNVNRNKSRQEYQELGDTNQSNEVGGKIDERCDKNTPKAEVQEKGVIKNTLEEDKAESRQMRPRAGRPRVAPKDRDFSCHICGKEFKTAYRLKRHEQSHTDVRPYACRTCGKRFKQSGHRNEHEANHQRQGIRFLCNKCGVVFRCRSSFNSHMRAHGREQTRQQDIANGLNKTDDNGTDKGRSIETREAWEMVGTAYDCPYCVEKFATAQALNNHLDSHVEVAHRRHVQPYSCDVCRRTFTYRHNLLKHNLIHKAPEKFADFFKEKMEAHVASGKPSYKCSHCSKVFIRKETLAKHAKIHTGLKPFKCSICSQSFTQNIHLKVHMRKHTGSRPFQCRECGKGFIDSTALAKHIEYEACNSENYVYYCKLCDKRHYYLGSIKQHMRKDHNIQADDMDTHIDKTERVVKSKKAVPSKDGGQNEQEGLDNERHHCLICSRRFKEKANLLRHVKRKHTKLLKLLNKFHCEKNSVLATSYKNKILEMNKARDDLILRSKTPDCAGPKVSCTSSSNDSEGLGESKRFTTGVNDSGKTIPPQENSKLTHDIVDHNSERHQQYPENLSQNIHNSERNQGTSEENVDSAASVSITSSSLRRETFTDNVDREDTPGQPEDFDDEDQGHAVEGLGDTDSRIETSGEASEDMLSPCENFLYQIGLTVSRKGKRSTKTLSPCSSKSLDGARQDTEYDGVSSSLERGTSFMELINGSKSNSSEFGTKYAVEKKQDTISEDISVLELDAKQLYCKDGFTGESFVVDLNKLDVSEKGASSETSTRHSQLGTASSATEKDQLQAISVKRNKSKNIEKSTQICDTTQPSLRKHTCSPIPLDLSQTHLRATTSQAMTTYSSRKQIQQHVAAPPAHRYTQPKDKNERSVAKQAVYSPTNLCEAQPNSSKQTSMEPDLGLTIPSLKKRPTADSRKSSTTTQKYFIHVPYTTPFSVSSENVSCTTLASSVPNPGMRPYHSEVPAPLSDVRDREMNERPIDLSKCAMISGVSSYEAVVDTTSTPSCSYSTAHFPTVLGLTGTSIVPPGKGHWGDGDSDKYENHDPDAQSRWDDYRTLPNIYPASNHVTQAHDKNDFRPTRHDHHQHISTDFWTNQGYHINNTTNYTRPMSLSPQHQQGIFATSTTTRPSSSSSSSPASAAAAVPQAAQNSPPSLPDSTMTTSNGFSCGKCGKVFNARHRLKRHELTHTDFRPYSCPQCGRAFRQKIHLSDHMKRHAGHRPFSCTGCGKRFILKNEMNQHVKHYCCGGNAKKDRSREALANNPLDSPVSRQDISGQVTHPDSQGRQDTTLY